MKQFFGALGLSLLLFGCAQRSASPPSPPGEPRETSSLDGRRWLEREATMASSLGAGDLRVLASGFGTDGDRIGAFVEIPEDLCLLAYARGSGGIDDLDMYAFADDGATLAIDEASDPHPAIVICPPLPSRAYIAARIAQGRGMVAIGIHSVAKDRVAAIGQALGARGRPGEEVGRAESWPGLDERIAERRRALGGEWEELRRTALPADARAPTYLSTDLQPGRCLDVLVLPSEELLGLDFTILDENGRIAARAAPWGRETTALVCSTKATTASIELRPHAGHGLAAVVLSRSVSLASHEFSRALPLHEIGAALDLESARKKRTKELRELGYASFTTVAKDVAEVGRKASFEVDLPEGCGRLDIIGGHPISGLLVDLWDASGKLLAGADGSDSPSLFFCGAGGKGRVDIEASSRMGPFAIELRREASSPAPLVAHPLAASRLLSHLLSSSPRTTCQAAADARSVSLEPSRLETLDLALPEGRCVDFVAALGEGASGLELRLLGLEGGELALSRGHTLAAARVCGEKGLRAARAEIRVRAGQAKALVLVRAVGDSGGR